MTLADLQEWDPEQINEVADAAASRARHSREAAQNIANLPVFATWHGEASATAQGAMAKSSTKMELSAQNAFRVWAGAGHAYQEASAVKQELNDIFAEAAAVPAVHIDTARNTVIAPDTSGWADSDIQAVKAKVEGLQHKVAALLANAEKANSDLAAVLRAATGTEGADGKAGELPAGASPPQGPPNHAGAGKPRSLEDMLLPAGAGGPRPRGVPPSGKPNSADGRAADGPMPQLKPADVESFKAMARQSMARDGMPPDQIEARLDAIVASTQQWMNNGMPNYVPPQPQRPPPPGFGEGFGDRWRATEQGIKNLIGQGGPGAPGVFESWKQMLKGTAEMAENPLGAAAGEIKSAVDSPSPAYYLGAKASDAAVALPGLLFGGEGAAVVRAGELGELDAAAGLPHDLPANHPPAGAGDPLVTGIGERDNPLLADYSNPDWNHSHDPYPVDSTGHYLPGSLPSYDQLLEITSTEPNSAYYWSGRNAAGIGVGPDDSGIAELIADGSGNKTLEMTLAENGVDPLPVWNRHDPVSVQFWEDASTAYAENARGEVTAVIGSNLRPGNIWQDIEIPRLMENQDVTRIVQIDPDTGESIIIFERGK